MAELDDYVEELAEVLTVRRADLEENVTPKLKEHYRRIRSSFEAIFTVLSKKGVLKDDPYGYEERVSELLVPDDVPFLESERDKALSERLNFYRSRIEYLTESVDFSLDALTLKQLRQFVKFARFLQWERMSEASTKPTTRSVAEMIAKVKRSTDQFSANVVADGQEQLNRIQSELLGDLKSITNYMREEYKYRVRKEVLGPLGLNVAVPEEQHEVAVQKIRRGMPRYLPGEPFARELLIEIFTENDPGAGPTARSAVLESMAVKKVEKPVEKKGPDLKQSLLGAARTLAGNSRPLELGTRKLSDNLVVLDSRKLSFGEMLRKIWDRMRGKDGADHIFIVEYVDEQTNGRRTEKINFDEFLADISRRVRIYNGILSKGGTGWVKLEASSEDEILAFVTKEAQSLTATIRRFESIDTYFRTEVAREQRPQLRPINAEVLSIRENIVRARKMAHEYVAKTEEREQLRRLGIK